MVIGDSEGSMCSFAMMRLETSQPTVSPKIQIDQPPFHVWLDVEEVLKADAPGFTGRRFKHKTPELWVENRSRVSLPVRSTSVPVQVAPRQLH